MSTREFCKAVLKEFEAAGWQTGYVKMIHGNLPGEYIIYDESNSFRKAVISYAGWHNEYRVGRISEFFVSFPLLNDTRRFSGLQSEIYYGTKFIFNKINGYW